VQVSFPGVAPVGPLYVLAVAMQGSSSTPFYMGREQSPVSPQSVTVSGLPPGKYVTYVILDRGRAGEYEPTDPSNVFRVSQWKPGPTTLVTGSAVASAPAVTLLGGDVVALAQTDVARGSSGDFFGVNLRLGAGTKQPAAAALLSGPGLPGVMDLALDQSSGGFLLELPRNTAPVSGDTYAFAVTYSDGSTANVNAVVSRVLPFGGSLAPAGTGGATPTFSWSFSPALPADVQLFVDTSSSGPGGGSWSSAALASTTTSVVYNADGSAYQAVLPSGGKIAWGLNGLDAMGNRTRTESTFVVPCGRGCALHSVTAGTPP
jgi:hypothetical protein